MNLIAEQEITKPIYMVARIHDHLDLVREDDPDLEKMQKPTHVHEVSEKLEKIEEVVEVGGR